MAESPEQRVYASSNQQKAYELDTWANEGRKGEEERGGKRRKSHRAPQTEEREGEGSWLGEEGSSWTVMSM